MDDPVDALFALPPSEFTAARNALVKQLRAEKRKDEAEAVKALKRPSVPAWAINQVARAHPESIERLIEAGTAIGAAQRRALSGVRDAGLREASAQRRERIDELWRLAVEQLNNAGTEPTAHRQAIAATLEAASVEPEAANLVRRGRLSVDLPAPSGFGEVAGFSLVPNAAPEAESAASPVEAETAEPDQPDDTAAREALAQAQREASQAQRRATELQDRAADVRRTALRTADEADRLERRAAQARARAEKENAEAGELAAAADAAQEQADEAAQRERQAREALEAMAASS